MADQYLVDEADLTAIADAIRSKGGVTDLMVFPNGFVDLINAIETGGGDNNALVETGTVTLSSDTSRYTITTTKRPTESPTLFFWIKTADSTVTGTQLYLVAELAIYSSGDRTTMGGSKYNLYSLGYNNGTQKHYYPNVSLDLTKNGAVYYLFMNWYPQSANIKAGTYYWVAIWEDI